MPPELTPQQLRELTDQSGYERIRIGDSQLQEGDYLWVGPGKTCGSIYASSGNTGTTKEDPPK